MSRKVRNALVVALAALGGGVLIGGIVWVVSGIDAGTSQIGRSYPQPVGDYW